MFWWLKLLLLLSQTLPTVLKFLSDSNSVVGTQRYFKAILYKIGNFLEFKYQNSNKFSVSSELNFQLKYCSYSSLVFEIESSSSLSPLN